MKNVGTWYRFLRGGISVAIVNLLLCSGAPAQDVEESTTLAQRVDRWIDQSLHEQSAVSGPECDDATFLRRVTLDLTGKNPTSGEIVAYLRSNDPGKRAAVIDRLLASPSSAVHLANTWSAWLLPEMMQDTPSGRANGLHTWLRDRFANNLRYDRLVSDLLVASGPASSGAGAFFVSLEAKPEKIAAKTARVFLGVQLDCAECHDHPFDHWKQRDFWGFAAYFARLGTDDQRTPMPSQTVSDRDEGEVMLPNTTEVVPPQPLVTTGMSGLASGTRRQQLTLWLTARENPYLARAAVNRCWSILFGRGLVEPIDDMRASELATHPELLRELAQHFSSSGFDIRQLLRQLANTRAYQRASRQPRSNEARANDIRSDVNPENGAAPGLATVEDDEASYAWMPVKPLTSLQMAACLQQVARDVAGEASQGRANNLASQLGKLRGDRSTATLGIVQALVTLHSQQLDNVHDENQSRLLKALTAPHLDATQRLNWLFLSTLCRPPRDDERTALTELIPTEPSPAVNNSPASWQADLLWALVNSTEFAMTP